MRHLTLFALLLTSAPALAAEATITVRACVLDTQAGADAARVARSMDSGPTAQLLHDGLVQVRHEAASDQITIEFVAN